MRITFQYRLGILLVICCYINSNRVAKSQKIENSTSLLTASSPTTALKNTGNTTSAKLVRGGSAKFQRYGFDDKVFMATVIGTSGMNFSSYFHMVGETCLDKLPRTYEAILKNFEVCLDDQDHLVQPSVWKAELKVSPEPCVAWKIYRSCYTILSMRYKECLIKSAGKSGSKAKSVTGVNSLTFLEAYGDAICKRRDANEADRFAECFWRQQEPVLDCVREDKIQTMCPQFTRVQDCFDSHFDLYGGCRGLQPIDSRYLKIIFQDVSYKLDCSKPIQTIDSEWSLLRPNPSKPRPTSRPRPGDVWEGEWGRPSKPWENVTPDRGEGTVIHVHGNHIQILTGTPARGYQVDITDRGRGRGDNNRRPFMGGSSGGGGASEWKQVKTDDGVILTRQPIEPKLSEEQVALLNTKKPSELDKLRKLK